MTTHVLACYFLSYSAFLPITHSELEQFQGAHQKLVHNILRSQTQLKRLMEGYAIHDNPELNSSEYLDKYMRYHW